jgi:hypothetical protein
MFFPVGVLFAYVLERLTSSIIFPSLDVFQDVDKKSIPAVAVTAVPKVVSRPPTR